MDKIKKIICFILTLSFLGIIILFALSQKPSSEQLLQYEFSIDSAKDMVLEISIPKELKYQKEPYRKPQMESEGSTDWGIRVYLTEGENNYLYFYASHGIQFCEETEQETALPVKKDKELTMAEEAGRITGQYLWDDKIGIYINVDEQTFQSQKKKIILMIKSANVWVKYTNGNVISYETYINS